jgi:aminocarboxymuconate-semialdehyde decarboxylase
MASDERGKRLLKDLARSVREKITPAGGPQLNERGVTTLEELAREQGGPDAMPGLSIWRDAPNKFRLTRANRNAEIARMIAAAPERFIGLGCVPLQDIDSALNELTHVVKTLKFSGVEIASHVNGVSIGDERFEPFFAEAERLGASIFVHALRPAGQDRIVGAFAEQAVCFPGDVALACASMITGGIASRHPKLRIAFSHGGGTMAILMPRLVHAWNVFPKAKESLPESPATIARRFFYDELVFDPEAVKFLVKQFGASQIVLGTDYPFALGDFHPLKTLESASLDAATITGITSSNARRFLGLPAESR